MTDAELEARIRAAVDAAPPLSPTQRARLAAIFAGAVHPAENSTEADRPNNP
jgi:hypothetical protein